jgi:hypothetical protein
VGNRVQAVQHVRDRASLLDQVTSSVLCCHGVIRGVCHWLCGRAFTPLQVSPMVGPPLSQTHSPSCPPEHEACPTRKVWLLCFVLGRHEKICADQRALDAGRACAP